MNKHILSVQNPQIKQLIKLSNNARERKNTGQFVIEGFREISLAISGGYAVDTLFYCPEINTPKELITLENLLNTSVKKIEVTKHVYEKIAYRSSTEGLIALTKSKELNLKSLQLSSKNPLILIAEAPEKPGNLGALLRSADAANVDAFIIANPKTDIYNPNIIRSSVGCVFTVPVATGTATEVISFLKEQNIKLYSAILQDSIPYYACDFKEPTAIAVGTEATGLNPIWRAESTQNIHIPMQGVIDSMNVSVAAGILIFEAKRQRGFK